MTQVVDKQQIRKNSLIEKVQTLTPEQIQDVLDFIEFLQFKAQQQQKQEEEEETEPISAYEAFKEFVGCVDGGPGDLATNKKYLAGPSWE